MIPIPPPDWLMACAERLHERWQTVTAEQRWTPLWTCGAIRS